jgi:hypothetical protein
MKISGASSLRISLVLAAIAAVGPVAARAQGIHVGVDFPYVENVDPPVLETLISAYTGGSSGDGTVTFATFGWSATGCPAAVMIRFYHPRPTTAGPATSFQFIDERGPFDVTSPLQPAGTNPAVIQSVALAPPVPLQKGDLIAIYNRTTCGGPTYSLPATPLPTRPPATLLFTGDAHSDVSAASATGSSPFYLAIHAEGPSAGNLGLLGGRFDVALSARNPRTGQTTKGVPVSLDDAGGYFSLPAFTGDPTVPELTVKMVDATGAPAPFGGSFWFFYSSLTDVEYTFTVTDVRTLRVRGYSSTAPFCGGADTAAFPP